VAQGGPRAPGKELAPLPPARRDTSQKRYTSFKNLQELPELNWASRTYKDGCSAPPINFEKCTMIGPTEVRTGCPKKGKLGPGGSILPFFFKAALVSRLPFLARLKWARVP